ncbi:MAG: PIN domain-containing protein [Opitutales bacterium]|nr:PIN domain-containing protein [Opitutales bacterium]
MVYLDTHVVVWLYAGQVDLLSGLAKDSIDSENLLISPMVGLELQFLSEIGRIKVNSEEIVNDLSMRIGLRYCELPFTSVVTKSLNQHWTRDPFDRIIVAQASLQKESVLLTKDSLIQKNYLKARW